MKRTFEWLEPWYEINKNASYFENQLYKETGQGHILFGKKVMAIGRREDRDDILFEIDDSDNKVAVVHLTYSKNKETNPSFPRTRIYDDIEEWVKKCMEYDHTEYTMDDDK
jgi:hypothetical protein